jgi:hypothetical protein
MTPTTVTPGPAASPGAVPDTTRPASGRSRAFREPPLTASPGGRHGARHFQTHRRGLARERAEDEAPGYTSSMQSVPEIPVELTAALTAAGEDARQHWAAAPLELQKVYIDYVRAPRRRRVRRERADDTALSASLGTLREQSLSSLTWWDAVMAYLPF